MSMLLFSVEECKAMTIVSIFHAASYKFTIRGPAVSSTLSLFWLYISLPVYKPVTVGEALLGVGYSDRYIAQDIVCNGTEYGLDMCRYSNATDSCNGQHVAGFRCTQS